MQSLIDKQQFALPEGISYLDTAAEGIPPLAVEAALAAYWREKSKGTPGRKKLYEELREAAGTAARLLGTDAENIAFLSHTTEALNLLANSITWRPGDEVLICDLEFPSNVVVWLRLRSLGVKVVVVPSSGGRVELEDWKARLSERTRVVSVSKVSYKSGTRIPYLEQLAGEAHAVGALFCVDATQALGRVPAPLAGVDFLAASSYKWLLGSHGVGVVYASPRLRELVTPASMGWFALEELFHPQRFETYTPKRGAASLQTGMPNFPGIFALKAGLECILQPGVERIDQELRPLVTALRNGLVEQGWELLTPAEERFASGIVSFQHPQPQQLAARLAGEGVIVWGGDGRIRISVHLYSEEEDVARCLSAIRRITAR
ncbi:MAG: aminotransferase class V-fold PLP-dependent enzyme [Bryobacterales bacterium]|nr:aminotransferase class V-fold PLP-dependent enzyme [Bryobacterales bacterium]